MALSIESVSEACMGKIGKGRILLSTSAPKEIVSLIDARAEALGWSRAQFTLAIIEQWEAAGAKPVSKTDATMAPEVMAKFNTGNSVRKAS